MKYVANPVVVDAYRIQGWIVVNGQVTMVQCENGLDYRVEPEMLARYAPRIGDYVVIQSDGYRYFNPRDVFERKYRPYVEA